jgi:hypothetical protein
LEDILHPSELKLLEKVLVIANDYTTVKQFIEINLYDKDSTSSQDIGKYNIIFFSLLKNKELITRIVISFD